MVDMTDTDLTASCPESLVSPHRGAEFIMSNKKFDLKVWMAVAACVGLGALNTGCQVHVAGQTLPSAYYLDDDVQYFPAGPENKLANETAALKAARQEAKARR